MRIFLPCLAGLLLFSSMASHARIFVDVPGIPGDSLAATFEGTIDAFRASGSFALETCGEFEIGKETDSATAGLINAAVTGQSFSTITISYVRPDSNGQLVAYQTLALNNAVVTSISTQADAGERPLEIVSLQASTIDVTYTPAVEGPGGGPITTQAICGKVKL